MERSPSQLRASQKMEMVLLRRKRQRLLLGWSDCWGGFGLDQNCCGLWRPEERGSEIWIFWKNLPFLNLFNWNSYTLSSISWRNTAQSWKMQRKTLLSKVTLIISLTNFAKVLFFCSSVNIMYQEQLASHRWVWCSGWSIVRMVLASGTATNSSRITGSTKSLCEVNGTVNVSCKTDRLGERLDYRGLPVRRRYDLIMLAFFTGRGRNTCLV